MEPFEINEIFYNFFSTAYKKHIYKVKTDNKKSLNIDYRELEMFSPSLADTLIDYPELVIKEAEKALVEATKNFFGQELKLNVRFYNIPEKNLLIENISSSMINKLISFKGLVSRRGEQLNKAIIMIYKCTNCEETIKVFEENEKQFYKCPVCKKGKLKPLHDKSIFTDYQRIEVQDLLERVTPGTQAAKIHCIVQDDLVNAVVPGDNLIVTGILRINPSKAGNNIFTKYVEVVHIEKLKKEFEELDLTSEDLKAIHEFAKQDNVTEKIKSMIAPDIHGYEEIKLALALQLFGGKKDKVSPAGMTIRDNIHILLVGDPGIAKTKFLQEVCSIAPKSIYVSGKGVSSAGLTATAEKDELSGGGWTLKAGALVLASGGIAAIDEFDKIDDQDRAALHEVMESGTVSIAKAGIVATFKAKTSVLAAANPKLGRFIDTKNITDQFNIPPSLLSRFDLIFPIMDTLKQERDRELAKHILSLHMKSKQDSDQEIKNKKTFVRKYIAYARTNIKPELTQEASEEIENFYVEVRSLGEKTGSVPITPRYLEGIIRLAEAHAKLRLSNKVEAKDAEVAITLMKKMLNDIIRDKETGKLDIDILHTGTSSKERDTLNLILDVIRNLEQQYDGVEIAKIIQDVRNIKPDIEEYKIRQIIEKALRQGLLYEVDHGVVKTTS